MGWADGDGIRAYPQKTGVTQADLTGKAHEQIEAHDRERKNENKHADAIVVRRRKEQRQDNDDYRDHYRRHQSSFEQCTQFTLAQLLPDRTSPAEWKPGRRG